MRKNQLKALAVAMALTVVSGSAFATWQDGYGVVKFASTNTEKIIYSTNVNPYTSEASVSTNQTNYNTWANSASSYPNRNYTPAGYLPGIAWTSDDLEATITLAKSSLVWKSVGVTGTPLSCARGTICGEIAQVITKDKCTSRDFGLGVSGSSWKTKIKYLEQLAGLVNGTFSTGMSTCTGTSIAHTCYAGDADTPSGTLTYATIEHRAKWAYARLTPSNGTIYEGSNGQTVKNICAAAGGSYRWDTFDGTSFCTGVKNKVHFEKYQVFPVSGPSTAACRITGNQ